MATSAIQNFDNRRESDDAFSINKSGESAPKTTNRRHKQRKKRDWRLRHLAEK